MIVAAVPAASAAPRNCAAELLTAAPKASLHRLIIPRDLIGLRDFGSLDNSAWQNVFNLSPDGKIFALTLRRGDPDSDAYCFGVVLFSLDRHAPPRLLDIGGEFIQSDVDIRGIPAVPTGVPRSFPPVWSPDGRWLAYLRRDGGVTRAWYVGVDGKPARPTGDLATDALAVRWSSDGNTLLVTIRPALDAGRAEIDREGRAGFHFDERFASLSEDRPLSPSTTLPEIEVHLDPNSGEVRPAGTAAPSDRRAVVDGTSDGGWRVSARRADAGLPYSATPLRIERSGKSLSCPIEICGDHVAGFWWLPGDTLLFLRAGYAGNGGRSSLFRWRVGRERAPRRLLVTDEALFGCQLGSGNLICAREAATQPRQIVAIDPASGRMTVMFDPNPDFRNLRLGSVERIAWTLPDGGATYGDLVLPPDHRAGQRHPLIVTQYISRGFLRGGTGDEYPIQILAAHGFAVLSFQRPALLAGAAKVHDLVELQKINIAGWAERRVIVGALEMGVDTVIQRGVADPTEVGLTGMSDGATTTQFALNHSNMFAAAAISSCCDEPSGLFVSGPAYGEATLAWGYPRPGPGHAEFWAPMSIAAHAAGWRVPLLVQVPDMEYRSALETLEAFRLSGAPLDAFVFPDEHHVKWHPAHKLAVYERSVAWFDFWLRDVRSEDPARAPDIARWEEMKRRLNRRPPR
ncbi:Atxe2 family lasso peptide isopeptidase [Sphingomonas sp. RT2P30]